MKFIPSELGFCDFAFVILDVAEGFRFYSVRPVASISGHSDPNHILHTQESQLITNEGQCDLKITFQGNSIRFLS
jgi:hypothetical protein